jgi:Ni,Fe-hydrogenase III small subunit
VTTRMREPLLAAYHAMPEPRRVAALGDCALGCGVLGLAEDLVGPVQDVLPVDVVIPGCPPSPERIAAALLAFLDGTESGSEPAVRASGGATTSRTRPSPSGAAGRGAAS